MEASHTDSQTDDPGRLSECDRRTTVEGVPVEAALYDFAWALTYRGRTWFTDTLTFDELSDLEFILRTSCRDITPATAAHVPAILFAFLKRSIEPVDAKAMIADLKVSDINVDFIAKRIKG